jgi:uncharacterized protein (TIGR00730 family)
LRICVFCASSPGTEALQQAARQAGSEIARRGHGLVYGGANVGLMKIVAEAALEQSGEVVGVIPQALRERELAHPGLTRLEVVGSMHERKARMEELSDAFLALPGGFGTWDELCEILTWRQLGLHAKPIGLLNVDGFFDPLLAWAASAVAGGVLKQNHAQLLACFPTADQALVHLERPSMPVGSKWR